MSVVRCPWFVVRSPLVVGRFAASLRTTHNGQRTTLLLALLILSACVSARGPKPEPVETQGLASWYGQEFAGRITANGEIFDPQLLTAAHRTLPFGTILEVTNPANGQQVQVRINDRGPFVGNRILDLSYGAARKIGMVDTGVGVVEMRVLKLGLGEREPPAPYVVKIPDPRRDASAPPIAFPLPEEVRSTPGTQPPPPQPIAVESVSVPAPQQAPTLTPRYLLQIGAFQIEANADEFRRRVASVIPDAFVELSSGLYRVRVGPFESKSRAQDMRERLEASGFHAILVTVE